MEQLGHCGGPIPGGNRLAILVGDPADVCPTAAVQDDDEVMGLVEAVPGPNGPGFWGSLPEHELTPFQADVVDDAREWLTEWRRNTVKRADDEAIRVLVQKRGIDVDAARVIVAAERLRHGG